MTQVLTYASTQIASAVGGIASVLAARLGEQELKNLETMNHILESALDISNLGAKTQPKADRASPMSAKEVAVKKAALDAVANRSAQSLGAKVALSSQRMAQHEALLSEKIATIAQHEIGIQALRVQREKAIAAVVSHARELTPRYCVQAINTQRAVGTRIESSDGRFHAQITAQKVDPQQVARAHQEAQWRKKCQATESRMHYDPSYRQEVERKLHTATACIIETNSPDYARRIEARLKLPNLVQELELPEPFYTYLTDAVWQLETHYFKRNGELKEDIRRDNFMREVAEDFIGKTFEGNASELLGMKELQELPYETKHMGRNYFRDFTRHSYEVRNNKIRQNADNQPIVAIIEQGKRAYETGDFKQVEALQAQHSRNAVVQKIAGQYKSDYNQAVYQDGILRVGLNDPLYKNLTAQEKNIAKSSPGYKERLNQELLQRHALKTALQKRWNIHDSAPQVVHDALYEIISGMAAGQSPLVAIHEITSGCTSAQDYKMLMNAFYLPYGALKEVAHQIPKAKRTLMPKAILEQEHASSRFMFNQFLIDRHVFKGTRQAEDAKFGTRQISKFLNSGDAKHLSLARKKFKELHARDLTEKQKVGQKQKQKIVPKQKAAQESIDAKSSMPMPPDPEQQQKEKLEHFAQEIKKLEAECGKENVDEALKVHKVDERAILHRQNVLEQVKETARDLKEINSNPRCKPFKYDPAQGNKVTLNSIDEAMAGKACEEQGLLDVPITRSLNRGEDFIDASKQAWDVKTPRSYALNGKYIFDAKDFVCNAVKPEYPLGENVIINITKLEQADLGELYKELLSRLTKSELSRTIIVHARNLSLSKTSADLIKLLKG